MIERNTKVQNSYANEMAVVKLLIEVNDNNGSQKLTSKINCTNNGFQYSTLYGSNEIIENICICTK